MRVSVSLSYRTCMRSLITIMLLVTLWNTQGIHISHASSGSGGANFSIVPTFVKPYDVKPRDYFIYTTFPGALITDHIHVTNNGTARGSAYLYVSDATTAPTGGTSYLPENAPQHDVSTWITLRSSRVTLNPGQSVELPFTLTVPTHVRPGQHGGIILAQEEERSQLSHLTKAKSIEIKMHTSIGLGVLVNIAGPTQERLITRGIHYDTKSQYQQLLIDLKNSGTQLLYPSGYVHIFDEKKKLVQNLSLQLGTFIPQTAIEYPAMIQHKPLLPGKRYTAALYLQYGHGYMLTYHTSFLVPIVSKSILPKFIQNLSDPVPNPSGDLLSAQTPWYIAGSASILFLIASSLFFWSQKIPKMLSQLFTSKFFLMLWQLWHKRDGGNPPE